MSFTCKSGRKKKSQCTNISGHAIAIVAILLIFGQLCHRLFARGWRSLWCHQLSVPSHNEAIMWRCGGDKFTGAGGWNANLTKLSWPPILSHLASAQYKASSSNIGSSNITSSATISILVISILAHYRITGGPIVILCAVQWSTWRGIHNCSPWFISTMAAGKFRTLQESRGSQQRTHEKA